MENIHLIKGNSFCDLTQTCARTHIHISVHTPTPSMHMDPHIYQGQIQIFLNRGCQLQRGEDQFIIWSRKYLLGCGDIQHPPPQLKFLILKRTHIYQWRFQDFRDRGHQPQAAGG